MIQNITLLGTSHIAKDSVKQVKQTFNLIKPDIVALELDPGRAYSLINKAKRPKNIVLLRTLGLSGFLFYVFGEFLQKKLGRIVNMEPGAEMLTALDITRKNKKLLIFIDRDIQVTLQRFSKFFRKRELLIIVIDIIKGLFKKGPFKIDITKLPSDEVIEFAVNYTKKRYPSLYKVLIDERDLFMAKKLYKLSQLYSDKKIFAVVGAGHLKGIKKYLEKFDSSNIDVI